MPFWYVHFLSKCCPLGGMLTESSAWFESREWVSFSPYCWYSITLLSPGHETLTDIYSRCNYDIFWSWTSWSQIFSVTVSTPALRKFVARILVRHKRKMFSLKGQLRWVMIVILLMASELEMGKVGPGPKFFSHRDRDQKWLIPLMSNQNWSHYKKPYHFAKLILRMVCL
jgi:hypothetical protein